MAESTITCPHCHRPFELTAAMSSDIEARLRQRIDAEARRRTAELDAREKAIADKIAATERSRAAMDEEIATRLKRERQALDAQNTEKLKAERVAIAAAEAAKARTELADELARWQQEKTAAETLLKERDAKLAEAQMKELDLLRRQRELEDAQRQLELSVERRLHEESAKLRDSARKESDEQNRLKLAELEKKLADTQGKLQEAMRKAEQGSQQLQGEVLELELETLLRDRFPRDTIEPVPKGVHGGDVLQRVLNPLGQPCGVILWESKRTKNWSDGWLPKLRGDQRTAGADAAVIVSFTLPKDVEAFDLIDGVYVAHPRCVVPIAMVLRESLTEIASVRQASEGQQTKMELIYQYLHGPRFRHRVQAIVEAFTTMQEDLDKERKAIMKQWDKRRQQLDCVMQATVGMYGDLQGIAGRTMQEIEGLDMKLLEAGEAMGSLLDAG